MHIFNFNLRCSIFTLHLTMPRSQVLSLTGSNTCASTLGSSIYSPAFPTIQHDFHVGSTVALLPLSLYVLALGFGPLLAAPMSETYGRHVVYLVSTPIGAGSIADVNKAEHRAAPTTLYILSPFLGPALG
jgi:MFS family permease